MLLCNEKGVNSARGYKNLKYAPNTGALRYIQQLLELRREIGPNTVIAGDFNTLLSVLEIFFRQKISKETSNFICILDQTELTDIYRTFHPSWRTPGYYPGELPNIARQANTPMQETQRIPQRYSTRKATPRHKIVRFTRVEMKEKMLRAVREKGRVTHKEKPTRLTADI